MIEFLRKLFHIHRWEKLHSKSTAVLDTYRCIKCGKEKEDYWDGDKK